MPRITKRLAERHEALVVRLGALERQVTAIAARNPELAVAGDVRIAAEDLLRDCRAFARGLGALPPAAPSYGGLAVQLGDAEARLEAFELRHSVWDVAMKCRAWMLTDGTRQPVERHNPKPAVLPTPKESSARVEELHALFDKRIERAYDNGYMDGYLAGKGEPWPRYTEIPAPTTEVWIQGVVHHEPARKG